MREKTIVGCGELCETRKLGDEYEIAGSLVSETIRDLGADIDVTREYSHAWTISRSRLD